MNSDDTTANIRRLMMLAADPTPPGQVLRDALTAFDDVPALTALATELATGIAKKVPWTPLVFDLRTPAQALAFTIARHAHDDPDGLDDFLTGLPAEPLAKVTLALLTMWKHACTEATRTAFRNWDTDHTRFTPRFTGEPPPPGMGAAPGPRKRPTSTTTEGTTSAPPHD